MIRAKCVEKVAFSSNLNAIYLKNFLCHGGFHRFESKFKKNSGER